MKKATKVLDLLGRVKDCLDSGRYCDTSHAVQRKSQRGISLPHILQVLRNGYHEKRKDEYKPEYDDWNYSIRGMTSDKKDIRVVVAFDNDDMLIITVIVLAKRSK
ncbi:MAG TPA: DUF4258 domain-containing protein [Chlamydiales bacterium]|nr:DUF4258 domain-containing protein [Chlamydiales bacterium]